MTRIFCQKGNEKFWIDTFTKDVSIVVNVGVDSSLLWLPIVSRPTMISQQQQHASSGRLVVAGRMAAAGIMATCLIIISRDPLRNLSLTILSQLQS